jgi:hypothetical protein
MKLTNKNYYGAKANSEFMSVSQFKDFKKCEAMALAKIKGEYEQPKSKALLLGSFVDEMLTGTKKSKISFIVENRAEIFQKSSKISKYTNDELMVLLNDYSLDVFNTENKPYAEIVQALEAVEKVRKQPLMMKYLTGEKQQIMTGEIAGVPFKIKMDSYKPGKFIADLKYLKDFRSPNLFENAIKYWQYDLQLSVYREVVRQNTGEVLPVYLVIVTKESVPRVAVAEVKEWNLEETLEIVKALAPHYQAIKNGEKEPERCEVCDYCAETIVLTEPIDSDLLGMSPKQIKAARGEFDCHTQI